MANLGEDFLEAFGFVRVAFEGLVVDAGDEEVAMGEDAAEKGDADWSVGGGEEPDSGGVGDGEGGFWC